MTDKEIIMIDGNNCTICNKLSHCNNNDLICRIRYYKVKGELQRKTQECEELKEQLNIAKINYANEMDYQRVYKQTFEKIKDIVTQINYTVAGGEESPKWEWIRLYRSIVWEISKILNEVKDD